MSWSKCCEEVKRNNRRKTREASVHRQPECTRDEFVLETTEDGATAARGLSSNGRRRNNGRRALRILWNVATAESNRPQR
mmetsp:Transcript_28021/g.47372  ORF Transcript_28021/g.47372 Transcript_28021/m.47372 type:complete len:80 (+) Transcript_28021:669-908(+)